MFSYVAVLRGFQDNCRNALSCILKRCDDHFGASLFFRIDSTTQFVSCESRLCDGVVCWEEKYKHARTYKKNAVTDT